MSKATVGLLIAIYTIAIAGFGLWEALREPFATLNEHTIATGLGYASGLFIVSAIIPFIVWTYNRYTAEAAAAPLILWAIIGAPFGFFMDRGMIGDRVDKVEKGISSIQLGGKDRDIFIMSAKRSCISKQQSNPSRGQFVITSQQMEIYCDCYANGILGIVTTDEMKQMALNNSVPASLLSKINEFTPACERLAFPSGPTPRNAPARSDPSPRGLY